MLEHSSDLLKFQIVELILRIFDSLFGINNYRFESCNPKFWSASPRMGLNMKLIVRMAVYRRAMNKGQKSELRQKQFNQLLLLH